MSSNQLWRIPKIWYIFLKFLFSQILYWLIDLLPHLLTYLGKQ